MIDLNRTRNQPWYDVKVGHWSVRVQGSDPAEAVVAARRKLSTELPRLWDVIHEIESDRFEVSVVRLSVG